MSLALAVVEASAFHTDDGCQVELHCFACAWALVATAVAALPPPPGPALEMVGFIEVAPAPRLAEASAPEFGSRAPPTL